MQSEDIMSDSQFLLLIKTLNKIASWLKWCFLSIVFAAVVLIFTGCAGYTINGIPTEKFKAMELKDGCKMVAGIATSSLVHFGGHVLAVNAMDKSWHLEDFRYEVVDSPMTDSEAAWMGRAGFIAQLFGGVLLNKFGPKESFFTSGYNIGTFTQIVTYPFIDGKYSDLEMINRNSNAGLELGLYTTASIYLMDIEKSK